MKQRISLIKKIDGILGPFILKNFTEVKYKKKPENIKKILLIRPGGMGDAALLLPVIKEIKLKYPWIIIDILCESRNCGIFNATPYADEIYLYDNIVSMLSLFKKKYDLIFDTEQSHFLSVIICRILRSKYRVGFDVFGRGRLFNHSIKYRHDLYEAQSFQNLFQQVFDLPETAALNPPYFEAEDTSEAVDEIIKRGIGKKIVCIFSGATIDERLWPEEKWAEVVKSLSESNCLVVLLGGAMEKKQCRIIKSLSGDKNAIDMSGRLSLLETNCLFLKSNILISTDSGILHLGVLSNIPTVSLFGSGISVKWAPRGEMHVVINKQLPCSPCTHFGSTPECMIDNSCMVKINSSDVLEAAKGLLDIK